MRAMILAAGRGERMRPLTDHTPKPLLKVRDKPLIVWHLENLAKASFKEVVINHAHLGSQIEAALGDGSQWGLHISYSPEEIALETAGGIAKALPFLTQNGMLNQPFLVVNGDIFTDIDFANISMPANMLAHLVLVDNPPQNIQGDFSIDNGLLTNQGTSMRTFSGVGLYHPNLFALIKRGDAAKLAPLLRQVILENKASAEYYQGMWHDIGTPQRLQALNE